MRIRKNKIDWDFIFGTGEAMSAINLSSGENEFNELSIFFLSPDIFWKTRS